MKLRGLVGLAMIGLGVIAGSAYFINAAVSKGYGRLAATSPSKTLGLGPISLGNPTAAQPGLRTTSPRVPRDEITVPELRTVSQTLTAGRGDTLAGLLKQAGAASDDRFAAITALKEYFNPRKFRKGQDIQISYRVESPDGSADVAKIGTFIGFSLRPDPTTEVRVERDEQGNFQSTIADRPLTHSLARADGIIESSLYVAGRKSGLSSSALAELIRAYSWDVDFQRDIRKGDAFQVMYEQVRDDDGALVKSDDILFATLTLSGKSVSVYRFKTADGNINYYNENGQSARKALMRTPIDGARLSSGFGKRKHPILGYTKQHTGVDFAAPRGTPIYAAGNGSISFAGTKGGYGRYIRIRHNGTYSTAYAHMKGFASGMRTGTRVNQGQIIGYVGTTGRSTGPHLHYEIIKNGRPTNPMRVKMPSGEKLAGKQLEKFRQTRTEIDQQFAAIETGAARVASSQ